MTAVATQRKSKLSIIAQINADAEKHREAMVACRWSHRQITMHTTLSRQNLARHYLRQIAELSTLEPEPEDLRQLEEYAVLTMSELKDKLAIIARANEAEAEIRELEQQQKGDQAEFDRLDAMGPGGWVQKQDSFGRINTANHKIANLKANHIAPLIALKRSDAWLFEGSGE